MDYKSLRTPLSQAEVARRSRVSVQTVLKTEQYLYSVPPPAVAAVLSQHSGLSLASIHSYYLLSRHRQRYLNSHQRYLSGTITEMLASLGSRQALCRFLCVHPSQLNRYLNSNGSDAFLREAMSEMGIPWQGK